MIPALARSNLGRLPARRSIVLLASSPAVPCSAAASLLDGVSAPARRRCMSSGKQEGAAKNKGFRPRRRPSRNYRPIRPLKKVDEASMKSNANNPLYNDVDPKLVELGDVPNAKDELENAFGPLAADLLRDAREEIARKRDGVQEDEFEEELREIDYLTAETGSTEDLVGERRALAHDFPDEKERQAFVKDLEAFMEEKRIEDLMGPELQDGEDSIKEEVVRDPFAFDEDGGNEGEMDHETFLDPNQLAHGEWSEMLIKVDRTTKLWRGGRLESYRALVIGGNLNGCGGFGIGKSGDPLAAVDIAGRMCKRNIFFVDRYQGDGLTRDLVGKQNSCKVILRATDNGLRGNELIAEILKRFGITNCAGKSFGNRNPYNVVRATFKALMTHESIEDIALKRGKRIVSIDRAMRMQV